MAKSRVQFVCRTCGSVQSRWAGKCPDCDAWDSLEEFSPPDVGVDRAPVAHEAPQAKPIADIGADAAAMHRLTSGIGELDRVLGGGLVPGSAVLIGGDPGIGKSTLMLQAAGAWAGGRSVGRGAWGVGRDAEEDAANNKRPTPHAPRPTNHLVLYVTSEESAQQLRLRAERLNVSRNDELYVLADTNLARIIEQIRRVQPGVVVVDSIQMIYKGDLPAAPGSVAQLRACGQDLVMLAKTSGVAVLMVGHVTKQGTLAGPRLLEHMVDTVLYFEGDRYHNHRIVRAIKNRFGTTLEVGLFDMTDRGLREVADGAGLLAAEYLPRSGSVVCPVMQGTRCLLIELQALTSTGFLGTAKRKSSGLDANRLAMLIAVLEKRGGLRLADQDIFASSIGGMRIAEPAADLALALAIAGAHHDRRLDPGVCCVGEVGLGGEVRHTQQMPQRLTEAARLGFTTILTAPIKLKAPHGAKVIGVKTVGEALEHLN